MSEKNPLKLRSAFEMMDGWIWLPRYIDKIRLHAAGKLPPDYVRNLGDRTDALWLKAAGVDHDKFSAMVRETITDGEVCEWVRENIRISTEEKLKWNRRLTARPDGSDPDEVEWFHTRKAQYGLQDREDVTAFVHFVEADEGRM